MIFFQSALAWLGVSTPDIERTVEAALSSGTFGAKLTGAGVGGSVIALSDNRNFNHVVEAISGVAATSFISTILIKGVKVWNQKE